MAVKESETKDMMVYFGTKYDVDDIQTVCINGEFIERVKTSKLLDVYINCDMSCDTHVD